MKSDTRVRGVPAFVLVVVLIPWITACGQGDLSRAEAAALMNKEFAQELSKGCTLNPVLAKKPEFATIAGDLFCDAEFHVTGVRRVSATEAIVEAKYELRGRDEALRNWLDAFDSLERRLMSLKARRDLMRWVFTDSSDGQTFLQLAYSYEPANIKDTSEWKELQNLRQSVTALTENSNLEGPPSQVKFQLYDDGWRVAK